jgi:hypothetical protein
MHAQHQASHAYHLSRLLHGDLARAWVEITSRPVTRGASMCVGIAEFLSVGWQLGERWEPTLAGLQRTYNNA